MKPRAILFLLASLSVASAGRLMPEKHYQKLYAEQVGGQMEVTAPDGSRVDILTEKYAIDVDFADKWAEPIGQSLNYGFQFQRRAGIVLIVDGEDQQGKAIRLGSLIRHYSMPIDLWIMDVETLEITKFISGKHD
jgi:hypothetical protein